MLNLKNVKVTASERKRLGAVISNWEVLHPRLVELERRGKLTPQLVEKMLKVEVSTRRRLVITTRLLGVYHRIVKAADERHVASLLAG